MKSSILVNSLLVASAFLVGCQPKAHDVSALAETIIVGPEYSTSRGLFVPDDTRRSLGLKIVEAGEQKLAARFELSLRIYEVAGDFARASGAVSPAQAETLPVGSTLEIQTADGGQGIEAKVTALNAQTQNVTGTVEVLVEIPKATEIAVGSFVKASAVVGTGENVTTVPRSALVQATDGYFVYTVSGKHFVRTPVKIGVLSADFAEVKEGLYSGDQVVSEPAMSLWMTELAAVKGGHACCAVPAKGK